MRREDFGIGALFGSVRDAVIVAEAKSGRIVLWNPAATRIFGHSATEATGMPVETLVPSNLKARHRVGLARYDRTGRGALMESEEYVELPALRKDGVEIRVELSLNPIGPANSVGSSGRYVLAIVRDVTRRVQAEEALRESEARMRGLADAAFEGILVTNHLQIVDANKAFLKTFKCTPEGVVGRTVTAFVSPEHRETIERHLVEVNREPYEIVGVAGDGTRLELECRSREYVYRGHSVRITAVQDLSERRRAEKEIRRLNGTLERKISERTQRLTASERRLRRLVGKLVTAQEEERKRVAYEIHDGLTQVAIAAHQHLQVFAADLPSGSSATRKQLDRALSLAQKTVREARLVIENLRPTTLDDFGLSAAVRLMVEELRDDDWTLEYEENLGDRRLEPEVETALYRVAQEAMNNVRKHAGTRWARLRLELRDRKVRLEVEDDGRGFDPDAMRNVAGPGERIGLVGMRERMDLLGGNFVVVGKVGSGTSVVAEVPVGADPDSTGKD